MGTNRGTLMLWISSPIQQKANIFWGLSPQWVSRTLVGSHCLKLLMSQVYGEEGDGWERGKGGVLCGLTDGFKLKKYRNPIFEGWFVKDICHVQYIHFQSTVAFQYGNVVLESNMFLILQKHHY